MENKRFCENCGAEVNGNFCPNCGCRVGSGEAAPISNTDDKSQKPAKPKKSASQVFGKAKEFVKTHKKLTIVVACVLIVAIVLAIALPIIIPKAQDNSTFKNATKINLGMSKSEVVKILGEPDIGGGKSDVDYATYIWVDSAYMKIYNNLEKLKGAEDDFGDIDDIEDWDDLEGAFDKEAENEAKIEQLEKELEELEHRRLEVKFANGTVNEVIYNACCKEGGINRKTADIVVQNSAKLDETGVLVKFDLTVKFTDGSFIRQNFAIDKTTIFENLDENDKYPLTSNTDWGQFETLLSTDGIKDSNGNAIDLGRFTFELLEDGTYSVTGYSGDFTGEFTIPSTYKGIAVTDIKNRAFYERSGLTSITIPDSVTSIGDNAFYKCSGLTSITIPDSVTNIGSSAFYACSGLTSITIPFVGASKDGTENTHFGYIFGENGANYIPSSLKTVIITGGTSIVQDAFRGCSRLTSITIPDSVTSIGSSAFEFCSRLTNVTIGNGVTNIGYSAFSSCSELANIYYTGDIADWCGISGLNNLTERGITLYISGNKVEGELIIPDGVTSIGQSAFYGCIGLTSITIPASVTSIGSSAFSYCIGLTSITIPDSVTSIGKGAFANCRALILYCEVTSKPNGWNSTWNSSYPVVWDCKNNDKDKNGYAYSVIDNIRYKVKDGIATVYKQTTNISGAIVIRASVSYKDQTYSVTSIGDYAFGGCGGLTSITIPDSVTSIGEGAFSYCYGLTRINFGGTMEQWQAIAKDSDWKYSAGDFTVYCSDGQTVSYTND